MTDWVAALAAMVAAGERAVLVTVAHAAGSAPREAGTTMVVDAAQVHGTIGGGHLEFEAMRIARDTLAHPATPSPWLVRFPLAARLGQCCGGAVTLSFVVVRSAPWLDAAAACVRAHVPFALVLRIGPDATPAPMLVTADNATGTLGHPSVDSTAIALARPPARSRHAGAWLAGIPGHDASTLAIHVVAPAPFPVLVFGNGHVGRALVQVLGTLPAQVRWIDARDADFPERPPGNVEIVPTDAPEDEIARAPRGAYVLILTHSHALDFALVEQALLRDDWSYLGLIGSKSKRNQFERRLAARGAPPAQLERIVCPIGATGIAIRSKEPGAIAVAVAAELLALRERLHARLPGTGADLAPFSLRLRDRVPVKHGR